MKSSVSVTFPSMFVGGFQGTLQLEIARDGMVVRELLKTLFERYPEIKSQIVDNNYRLNRFVIICVNNNDIRFQNNLDTIILARDEISIIKLISGG
tara:strand:- start:11 stop:298 length:288 start_codon:yes stop_codon:yes gene_type:complete